MARVSDNFILQEFVHPAIFERWGEHARSWLNCSLIPTVQDLREELGSPITINDWYEPINGLYENSGLRLPHGGVGAMLSAHKGGFAVDMKFTISTDEVLDEILSHPSLYPAVTRIENIEHTRGEYRDWLHMEVGYRHGDIVVFNP